MLITLIRRELLDNLMTFRFAAAVFIMLLLVVTNTAVLIKHYEQSLADYAATVKMHQRQLQETKTYSAGEMYVDRPPNPLRISMPGSISESETRSRHPTDLFHHYGIPGSAGRIIRLWICSPQWILFLSLKLS